MNSSSKPPSKQATLDLQVNGITKLLFVLVTTAALAMVTIPLVMSWITWGAPLFNLALEQRLLQAALDFACFILLFSQIIPISLRVALDVAKLTYKLQMNLDKRLPGLRVRYATRPSEVTLSCPRRARPNTARAPHTHVDARATRPHPPSAGALVDATRGARRHRVFAHR